MSDADLDRLEAVARTRDIYSVHLHPADLLALVAEVRRLRALLAPGPCGHPLACVTGDEQEGTWHCVACAELAAIRAASAGPEQTGPAVRPG